MKYKIIKNKIYWQNTYTPKKRIIKKYSFNFKGLNEETQQNG